MSEKTRRKKDGQEKSHDKQAMRAGGEYQSRERNEGNESHERWTSKDQQDKYHQKTGSNNDRSQVGAR